MRQLRRIGNKEACRWCRWYKGWEVVSLKSFSLFKPSGRLSRTCLPNKINCIDTMTDTHFIIPYSYFWVELFKPPKVAPPWYIYLLHLNFSTVCTFRLLFIEFIIHSSFNSKGWVHVASGQKLLALIEQNSHAHIEYIKCGWQTSKWRNA